MRLSVGFLAAMLLKFLAINCTSWRRRLRPSVGSPVQRTFDFLNTNEGICIAKLKTSFSAESRRNKSFFSFSFFWGGGGNSLYDPLICESGCDGLVVWNSESTMRLSVLAAMHLKLPAVRFKPIVNFGDSVRVSCVKNFKLSKPVNW